MSVWVCARCCSAQTETFRVLNAELLSSVSSVSVQQSPVDAFVAALIAVGELRRECAPSLFFM